MLTKETVCVRGVSANGSADHMGAETSERQGAGRQTHGNTLAPDRCGEKTPDRRNVP